VFDRAAEAGALACLDISLWEIALLIRRGRLEVDVASDRFLADVLTSRSYRVLAIDAAVAATAAALDALRDPADRLIAAASQVHSARLLTSDEALRATPGLHVVW